MKILILCSILDLSKPFGATPALWQLFKGFYEEGCFPLIVPYHGHAIDNFWWRCFENPNYSSGMLMEKVMGFVKGSTIKETPVIPYLARAFVKPKLFKAIKILQKKFILLFSFLNLLTAFTPRIRVRILSIQTSSKITYQYQKVGLLSMNSLPRDVSRLISVFAKIKKHF
jgi:hypothetical protein